MPTYDYACESCGHDLEVFQRMSEDPLQICPECDSPSLKRKIGTGAGIIFKGGGFYETDFKDKKGSSPKSGEGAGAKKDSSSGGGEKSSTKGSDKGTSTSASSKADS